MSNENNTENGMESILDSLNSSSNTGSEEQVKQNQISEGSGLTQGPSENSSQDSIQAAMTNANVTSSDVTNSQFIPQPHEQKEIDEYAEIHDRANKLYDFINSNPIFKTLPENVQFLRKAQLFHMLQYSAILNEIIYLFKGGKPATKSIGQETIGTFGNDNEKVFDLKYISMMMIDATMLYGNDGRRNAIVRTDMEKVQMMAVKSIFS